MLYFALFALLPLAAFAATEPKSAQDCETEFNKVSADFDSTDEQKCEALVKFSKCLAQFPQNDKLESLLFEKNTKKCESIWKSVDAPAVRSRRGNFELTVDDAKDVTFYRHRRTEINVFTMNDQISQLMTKIDQLEKALNASKSNSEAQLSQALQNMETALETKASVTDVEVARTNITNMQTQVSTELGDMQTQITEKIGDAKTEITGSVDTKLSQFDSKLKSSLATTNSNVDTKIDNMKTQVDKVATTAVDTPIHMWSGGSRSERRGSGWADFRYDRIEYDTSKPYFERQSDTRFRALKDGLFKAEIFYMSHANSRCWRHMQFYVDNQNIYGNQHKYVYSWMEMSYSVVWKIKAGQQFYFRSYISNCGNPYIWHSGSSWKSAHNRVQVTYLGKLEGKCASNQGLC